MQKELNEMTLEELWELFPIELTETNIKWSEWFQEECELLTDLLKSVHVIQIAHIGSTAIHGIWAKPIIDILVELKSDMDMEDGKSILLKNGYLCMDESDHRKDFNKGYTKDGFAEKVFHIHFRLEGDADELCFRDYLNEHFDVAKAYEALKLSLWKKYEHNRDAYTNAKTEFVVKYTGKAKEGYPFIGQGNTAEIFQFSDNQILKLFREAMPFSMIDREYKVTRTVQEYLDNIPKAYQMIERKNRYGIVYEQIRGTDMIKVIMKKPLQIKYYGRLLASTHYAVHKQDIDVNYPLNEKLLMNMRASEELASDEKEKIGRYLEQLPKGKKLCHMDYHPGNIMMRDEKPIIIDWMTACTGDSSADVARTVLLLRKGEMMHISPMLNAILGCFTKFIGRVYLREYLKLSGKSREEIES